MDAITAAVEADVLRRGSYTTTLAEARRVAARLPLVHRTNTPIKPSAKEILRTGSIRVSDELTPEEEACGMRHAVYFFLGRAAFDKGNVAFLVNRHAVAHGPGTFSCFDSGALSKRYLRHAVDMDEPARATHLANHSCALRHLDDVSGPFIAAHFNDPLTYVRAPQIAVPDYPAYHGLVSGNDDRRAWTIEARVEDAVAVRDPRVCSHIVVGLKNLRHKLGSEYIGRLTSDLRDHSFQDVPAEVERVVMGMIA